MTLDDYLRETQRTPAEFALQVGVSRSHIQKLRKDPRRTPSLKIANRINLASGGMVSINDWLAAGGI
jgi:DNA-binding XRE family transcriptional regulator